MKVGDTLEVKKEFDLFINGGFCRINEFTKHKILGIEGDTIKFKNFNMTKEGVKKHFKNDY